MSEMAKAENANEFNNNEPDDRAGSCSIMVNGSGTPERIGTGLTQPCSADVQGTRSMLKRLAIKHGATSAIGHASHNMLEMTEHLSKGAEGEQRRHLVANLERQQQRVAGIRNRKAGE